MIWGVKAYCSKSNDQAVARHLTTKLIFVRLNRYTVKIINILINHVKMQDEYVDMRLIYVNMQEKYVNMQSN